MLILNGKNLGERQKDLNIKVKEAALNNVDFQQIKDNTEQSDVDKLFKIDLASKYMNIEYIIEVLKSGDTLHISRALKCTWMYDDEFSNFINVDYLQNNVFSYMSLKMKKKFLTHISINVRNENRAAAFCDYCMNVKMANIALKFAMFTSDDFKLVFMQEHSDVLAEREYKNDLKYFIGSSFILADAFLATVKWESRKLSALKEINYLYSVSDVKYLDMLEKHVNIHPNIQVTLPRLGLRISKDILTKHKNRILIKPSLYVNFLNKSPIIKYSTTENAKIYATALFPEDVDQFWTGHFCTYYEYILKMIPAEERFGFLKKLFNNKYPDQLFEMNLNFFSLKYFRFMTEEQKEKWALDQIASKNEILGIGNDYKWYKFVGFDRAFDEVKKLVMITPDSDKRNEIVSILIESAKTQRDLEKLFKYYDNRHNNEQRFMKERFIDWVLYNHNVYEFDLSCWDAFNKIFENLDVYSKSDVNKCKSIYKIIALIYQVINNIDVDDALILFIDTHVQFYVLKTQNETLPKEKQEMVYQYLLNFYLDKMNELVSVSYEEEVKYKLRKYIHNILDVLKNYNRTKDDIPELVTKYMKLDWDEFNRHQILYEPLKQTTQEDLVRLLKKEANLVVENLPLVKNSIEGNFRFKLGKLLKKLKVYFSNDISKDYLNFYKEMLAASRIRSPSAVAACYGIFNLAEDSFKVDFMTKYAPKKGKFNRSKIDESLLYTQEAICSTAFYSRPPVPLNNMLMYVKGDYVPSCLPMFNSYSANLPLPLCMEFIERIIDNPVSIQKHGLRLAFAYFNEENLRKLILNIWNKTKNISLRFIIYKALYNKVLHDENARGSLFDTLKILTRELREDDCSDVFSLWRSITRLPKDLMSDYISVLWSTLSALDPNNKINCIRMNDILKYMCSNHQSVRQDIIRSIVEEFVKGAFNTEDSIKASLKPTDLNDSKWDLTSYYIIYVQNQDDLETKLEMAKLIITQCSSKYNLVDENTYIIRKFLKQFLRKLFSLSYVINFECYEYLNVIFETALQMLHDLFSVEDIYMMMWAIQMNILARKALVKINNDLSTIDDKVEKRAICRSGVLNFGKDIGNLIQEFMVKDMYYKMFLPSIQNELIINLKTLAILISRFEVKYDDVLVIASVAFLEFKTNDMYIFAFNILPSQCCLHYKEDYKYVLDQLRGLNNPEIRCKMYDKFVNSDFQTREFFQL